MWYIFLKKEGASKKSFKLLAWSALLSTVDISVHLHRYYYYGSRVYKIPDPVSHQRILVFLTPKIVSKPLEI
jgi:hypothetical protein